MLLKMELVMIAKLLMVQNMKVLMMLLYVLREKMDKYRHSVANCQSAQLGEYEEEVAKMLSDKKEIYDQHTYMQTHHVTLEKAVEDSERDQVANRLGRERGRKYCIKDLGTHLT